MKMKLVAAMASVLSLAAPAASQADSGAKYTGGDTSGCGKDTSFNGTTELRVLTSGDTERSYFIHLPSGYDKNWEYPTILGFHGSNSNGTAFEADTKLSDPYYTTRNIVVYPNGLGGRWAGASDAETSIAEDLQFVWDVLAEVRSQYCVDSARIYATGFSAGGGFVNTIACNDTIGGEFAAFAPASGLFYTENAANFEACAPARVPMPVIEIHGGADLDAPYDGGEGEGGPVPPIPDWINRWAERNECGEPSHQDINNNKTHYDSWTCKDEFGAVQHFKNDDQAHYWAGGIPTLIEATAVITDFFLGFSRPAEE